ncbi:squalene/phytoene synthase family protein [Acidiphilium sp. AL]|uniref:squalene/phytoene synthase family protein n=1 Tax=Acidiphilium sp. AL TaxID=2871704 RepID=UPI0021CB41E8|nr:squalene/phytoene synthase family protein [Acidiphilium sp. AL]MCU4159494.1 squalene/phytoene synthase family protein [Acidiphilium sp. AL]
MNEAALAALVRRADPDRFLGAIFAPAALRRDLLLLYAFNHELARAREVASSGPLALIRLHWWREVVEGARRDHPLAAALRATLEKGTFDAGDLLGLIDAREAEAEPVPDRAAFLAYARGTSGGLMRIAGRLLGAADANGLAALGDLGTGYAIAAILRAAPALRAAGRDLLPQDGAGTTALIAAARPLLAAVPPRAALAAALPAVLARRDLARLERGVSLRPRGLPDRLAVIAAGFLGLGHSRSDGK